MRVPMTATPFDALCWAIIGQQINIKFAAALRREMLEITGHKVEGMLAHPGPEEVANLDVADLTKRRFSGSKAEYLIHAARQVANKELLADAMGEGSAVAAEKALKNVAGALARGPRVTCSCAARVSLIARRSEISRIGDGTSNVFMA